MNVLIMRRASLSPWQGKDVWWFLQSGCRQSRSRKPTNRTLHRKRKRSEDRLIKELTKWDWCDRVINFYKDLSLLKWQLVIWMDTPTLTQPNPPHNRRMRSSFITVTKAQPHTNNCFHNYTTHCSLSLNFHTLCILSQEIFTLKKSCDSYYNILNITTHTCASG